MSNDFPAELVDLQKRSDQAWADVEAHRKTVDAKRRQEAKTKGAKPDWTPKQDARHGELLDAARQAAEALRAAILAAGLIPDYPTAQGLHKAARAAAEV